MSMMTINYENKKCIFMSFLFLKILSRCNNNIHIYKSRFKLLQLKCNAICVQRVRHLTKT